MAVECLTKQIFSSASDVWSFGVLMWELFNPQVRPYRKMDNMTVIAAVSAGQRLDIPEKCPQTVGQVMQACWNADSAKRPSFLVIANLLCRCIQQETPSRTTWHVILYAIVTYTTDRKHYTISYPIMLCTYVCMCVRISPLKWCFI